MIKELTRKRLEELNYEVSLALSKLRKEYEKLGQKVVKLEQEKLELKQKERARYLKILKRRRKEHDVETCDICLEQLKSKINKK